MDQRLIDKYLSGNKGKYVLLAITIGICALMGVIRYFTPYICDDLAWITRWTHSSEYVEDKPYILRALKWMYAWYFREDYAGNGRLGDLSTPFTVALMPNWLISTISAICILGMVYFAAKFACLGKYRTWVVGLTIFMLMEFLPWHNAMALRMYSMNYIWSSCLVLATLTFIFNSTYLRKTPIFIIAVVVAFISGTMHEAFSATVIAGLFVCFLFKLYVNKGKPDISRRQWMVIICFILGSMVTVLSPAMFRRLNLSFGIRSESYQWQIFWWVYLIPMCLYVIISIIYLIRNKKADMRFRLQQSFFISVTISNIILYNFVYLGYRVGWFGMLFCLTGATQLVAYMLRNINLNKTKVLNIVGIIVSILVLLQMADTARWQFKLYQQHQQVINKLQQSPDGNVFVDNFVWHSDIPFWANLHIGFVNMFEQTYTECFYHLAPGKPKYGIIPTEVYERRYTDEDFQKSYYYPVEGGYVFPSTDDSLDNRFFILTQTFYDWPDEKCTARYLRFKNKYGQDLTYLQIKYHVYSEKRKRKSIIL